MFFSNAKKKKRRLDKINVFFYIYIYKIIFKKDLAMIYIVIYLKLLFFYIYKINMRSANVKEKIFFSLFIL
jgi:hypothetical protein